MADATLDLATVWDQIRERLATSLSPQQNAMLNLTRPLGLVEDTAVLAAPNEFTQTVLESRMRRVLAEALSEQFGRDIRVAVQLEDAPAEAPDEDRDAEPTRRPWSAAEAALEASAPRRTAPAATAPTTAAVPSASGPTPSDRRPGTATSPRSSPPAGPPTSASCGRPTGPPPVRSTAGAPEDWATTTWGGTDNGAGDRDWGGAGDGRSADVLPFDVGGPGGDQRGRSAGGNGANRGRRPESGRPGGLDPGLNPKYVFDSFVIGNSNRFAHAAAVAVAEAPARAYNPLFIYGESGLGKTHLLHAIGHYAARMFPNVKVRYVSTEEFTNEFINLVHSGRAEDFRRRYRDIDFLLIDDIQFLERAERTQEEFFHTFNTLHNASKQIVITSDRAPKKLTTLEDRLRTRFEWGLITDVQAPDLETRIAILRKKAWGERLQVPDPVLEFIASKVQTNIRELEGALIRVTAFASLNKQQVDLPAGRARAEGPDQRRAGPADHRGDHHGRHRRVLLRDDGGAAGLQPQPHAGQRPADRHVPVPRAHRAVAAAHRCLVRRQGPHHGHARGQEDHQPDERAPGHLHPGHRAHRPHQEPRPAVTFVVLRTHRGHVPSPLALRPSLPRRDLRGSLRAPLGPHPRPRVSRLAPARRPPVDESTARRGPSHRR